MSTTTAIQPPAPFPQVALRTALPPREGDGPGRPAVIKISDNLLLQRLLGDHDRHLLRLERGIGVRLACRGNKISLSGEPDRVAHAHAALTTLHAHLETGGLIDAAEVDRVIRMTDARDAPLPLHLSPEPEPTAQPHLFELPAIRTKRGEIAPRTRGQADYMRLLARHEMVFGIGPAGTGKTYLAVAQAVAALLAGTVDRIVLSRPAVEAGERLGFLPGDLREKIDPYLRPLYDALHDMMPADQVARRMASGEIEVAPLAFMRGRTLSHAFVILDEAQNTTTAQMRMFLTRMGQGTRMVVTGDLTQIDLPSGVSSGLREAVETLEGIPGLGIARFASVDVVRHPLVARIVDAYDQRASATRDLPRARAGQENDAGSKSSGRGADRGRA